jgi:hypothetical protein
MALRLSDLRASRRLSPGTFFILISVRHWVDLRDMVLLEGLCKLKNSMTISELEPATFRLNQLHYRMPPFFFLFVGCDFCYCGHYWPIVPAPDDRWWWLWRNWWNEDWQGKPKYSEKTYPRATLSTTNPTWQDCYTAISTANIKRIGIAVTLKTLIWEDQISNLRWDMG